MQNVSDLPRKTTSFSRSLALVWKLNVAIQLANHIKVAPLCENSGMKEHSTLQFIRLSKIWQTMRLSKDASKSSYGCLCFLKCSVGKRRARFKRISNINFKPFILEINMITMGHAYINKTKKSIDYCMSRFLTAILCYKTIEISACLDLQLY